MKQEDIVRFQTLSQELEHIQEHTKKIDEQIEEVIGLIDSLQEFSQTKTGSNMLFPLANGIFAQGTITNNQTLKVNVGQDVVVEKTVAETKELVEEQLHNLERQRDAMNNKENNIYEELTRLEEQVRKEQPE